MEEVKNNNSVSLVTVTYTGDKWPMLLQAHSIEKFVKEPTTHYVIIEDQNGAKTSTLEWLCLLQPIYKKHKLVLLDEDSASELFLEWDKGTVGGWNQQQYIKLKIHELIHTEYYLTLDSKNIFVRPTSLSEFYGYEGCDTVMSRNVEPYHPSLSYWSEWMNLVEEITGKTTPNDFWFAGTPFNLKTSIVKDIFKYDIDGLFIKALDTTNKFPYEYDKHVRISEYILYAFFSHVDKDREIFWASGLENAKVNIVRGLFRAVFTMHRDQLSSVVYRKEVIDFLISVGLEPSYVVPAVMLDRKSQGH